MSTKVALVLGATGGIGGEVARNLKARGWTIRALKRDLGQLTESERLSGNEWIEGDAMSAGDVTAAANGVSVIVHAVNPPGYRKWSQLVLPMLDNTIAAARASGARIVLPGTVYNFGRDAGSELTESSPQHPDTVKGAIRVEMERRLQRASATGVTVLIVRAGDFFGPRAANNWFSRGLVRPGQPVTAITYPGQRDIGHQWAYLPDVAETMVRLLERAEVLDPYAVFHMEGIWDADGTQMINAIRRVTDKSNLKVSKFPWLLTVFLSPFVTFFRELQEMRYLWTTPVHMNNARLKAFLGEEPHTPLYKAVHDTLAGMGCLSEHSSPAGKGSLAAVIGAKSDPESLKTSGHLAR